MLKSTPDAAQIVGAALAARTVTERPAFLRDLMAHAAAGLVMAEGDAAAAEATYRLADAVVSRSVR